MENSRILFGEKEQSFYGSLCLAALPRDDARQENLQRLEVGSELGLHDSMVAS